MMKIFNGIVFCITVLILASCSTSNHVVSGKMIQKKKYTKGYFVSKKTKTKTSNEIGREVSKKDTLERFSSIVKRVEIEKNELDFSQELEQLEPLQVRQTAFTKRSRLKEVIEFKRIHKKTKQIQSDKFVNQSILNQKSPNHSPNMEDGVDEFALVGFIAGILSLLLLPIVIVPSMVLAITAIVFSGLGLKRTRTGKRGRGLAIAGLVTGLVSLFILIIVVLLILLLLSL